MYAPLHQLEFLKLAHGACMSRWSCAGLVIRRAPSQQCPVQSAGEGQMAINALQVHILATPGN